LISPPEGAKQVIPRKRIKHQVSFKQRLMKVAGEARAAAAAMPPSTQRNRLIFKARQHELAAQIDRWVSSPGKQLPDFDLIIQMAPRPPE
jgi:hypothetical protein